MSENKMVAAMVEARLAGLTPEQWAIRLAEKDQRIAEMENALVAFRAGNRSLAKGELTLAALFFDYAMALTDKLLPDKEGEE